MTRNRLLITIGVLVVILVGLSIYAFAILLPHTGQNAFASVTPTPSATLATPKANKIRKIVGTVQSLGDQTFIVSLSQGKKTITVNVNAKTKYTTLSGSAAFSDLKVGQMVQIRARVDPQDPTSVLAVSIMITPSTGKISTSQTLT